jgi:hypothetical protein
MTDFSPPKFDAEIPDVLKPEPKEEETGFIATLKEYKEFIAILVFFLAGVLWMVGYFATKKQLTELRCLMLANVEFIQNRMDSNNLSDMSVKNIEELAVLNEKTTLTSEEKAKRNRLEVAKNDLARKLAAADTASAHALNRLTSGQCSEKAD